MSSFGGMQKLLALTALLAACSTAPITGRKQFIIVSDDQMNQLGLQTYQQELAKAKPDTDPGHLAMVDRVIKRISAAAEKEYHPGYQWEAKVIDDPKTVNAWCLPGGKIAVYSGIFPIAKDENGLAVVLAHETAHALARHSAERMSRLQAEQGILSALSSGQSGASTVVAGALGLGAQLGLDLPFSREQESEADHIGLILMAKAGYDPKAAVDFWQRMLEYSKGKEPPAFLSDHPSSESRVQAIKAELPEAEKAFVPHS